MLVMSYIISIKFKSSSLVKLITISIVIICQVGYKASRFYWSMRTLYKRSRYICSIREKEGMPEFVVTVTEQGHEDTVIQNASCAGVWREILEPLEKLRKEADLVKVFPTFTTGEELYGLTDPNIVRLVESVSHTLIQGLVVINCLTVYPCLNAPGGLTFFKKSAKRLFILFCQFLFGK